MQTLTTLQKLKIDAELAGLVRQRMALQAGVPMYAFKVATVAARIVVLLRERGVDLDGKARELKAFAGEAPDVPEAPRAPTGGLYEFDEGRTHGQRKKDNAAALSLLRLIDAGEVPADGLTDEQKRTLASYSGTGGNLTGADGKMGSAYEYYTPRPIADGIWSMLGELGFKGGKVSDPCAGVGIFGATAPANCIVESVELNETSGRINQLVNGGPAYNAIVSPFEAVASRTADEVYDAVVSNVPFGGVHDRGSNRKIDQRYQDEPLETYFILRSLEKLRPGGLACFIVPPRVISAKGGREEQLRMRASYVAEFMGAYRLPNSVFGSADADTITDVIVLRKFGRQAAQKIDELREQNPAALIAANVLWTEFIDGRYFAGEGRRFVLGEFVAKDPTKFRDVDRVVSDQSVANIGKLLRKFPGSRIDWKALNATETEPIAYNDGDTMTLAGQTLEMRDGQWFPVGKADADDSYDRLGELLTSPLAAVSAKVGHEDAQRYADHLERRSLALQMPVWLRFALADVKRADAGERGRLWTALCAGLSVVDVMQDHSGEAAFNYQEAYPVLSDALVTAEPVTRKAPASWSRDSKAAFLKARIVYDRKAGFASVWTGAGLADVAVGDLSTTSKVNALVYTHGTSIEVGRLRETLGDHFDVHADDDWCLSADGTLAQRADDYYSGNLADFLVKLDGQIKGAPEGPLRQKLLRQREVAASRVEKVDPHGLKFNLFSPFVTLEEKAEFMRRFMDPAFAVGVNNLGSPYIVYEGPSGRLATVQQKLMSRIASYLSGDAGGRGVRSLTLNGKDVGLSDREALKMLRDYAQRLNTQFDGWVKSSPVIMDRLDRTANDPARLYFTEVDDNSPLTIAGMRPELALHGYQNAYVRKQARGFGGINGFDVGLGKTFTALAAMQYVLSIGVKKKTVVVVPNAVLSNWRREASRAYTSTDDCLFIGLVHNEKTGDAKVDPSNYARDWTRVMENRHRKVFCTMEAFAMLPLKAETVEAYEGYLTSVDPSFAGSEKKADDERAASKRSDVVSGAGSKSSAAPFFEDLGFDSLVSDEAHAFKNSKDTIDFSGARFLSVAEASQRGRDMQMKAWVIRRLSGGRDGVMPLTATPITNSPLEIYSMLTLAVGEQKVHDLCMGVAGADAFMDAMCVIEDAEDVGIDGTVKSYRVFTGLQNVDLLRNALGQIATIKTGADVKQAGDDLKLPEAPEHKTAVVLQEDTRDLLNRYKMAYRAAKYVTGMAAKNAEPPTEAEFAAFEAVQAKFGEQPELIGHPFNLIQKMTALIADPELDERATFYTILASQRDDAQIVIDAFNKLGKLEQRARGGPWTEADAVVGQTTIKDGESESIVLKIKVRARFTPDGRIVVDTTDYNVQKEFERLADKAQLDLDVSIPPKLAALLANVRAEEAHPRSATGRVKQLIFCDILPLHNKIKRLLTKHAGIPAAAIEIVSGQSIKNAEQMQDIQDGFNAEGEQNRLRAIIANEKAEVGINLQKGTQAIHHLTIGWTPDSQHQRNGRGVRQGNTTARVNIFHYDADGTFDEYKRTLTTKKADWIGAVMDKQGGNEVNVSGGLTSDQYDELIESMGDATAIQAIQDRAALREKLARAESARQRQVISLQTAASQDKFLKDFSTAQRWLGAKCVEAYNLKATLDSMRERNTSKMKAQTLVRFQSRIAELEASLAGSLRELDGAADWRDGNMTDWIMNNRGVHQYSRDKDRSDNINRYAHGCPVRPGTSLSDDYESQLAQARGMREEAFKEFERIGKQGGGAYSARAVDGFKAGQGVLVDNQPVVQGMFLRTKEGDLFVINENNKAVRYPHFSATVADELARGAKLIGFEAADYAACVVEAARLDDAQDGVDKNYIPMLFCSSSRDVAAARKTETLVKYRVGSAKLPAPHFPYPLNPTDLAGASEPIQAILREQAAIVRGWTDYEFIAASSAGIEEVRGYAATGNDTVGKALAGRIRALGLRLPTGDLGLVLRGKASAAKDALYYIKDTIRYPDGIAARLEVVGTRAELEAVSVAVVGEVCDWFVPDPAWTMQDVLPPSAYDAKSAYNKALQRIEKAEAEAADAAAAAAYAGGERTEQFRAYQAGIAAAQQIIQGGMLSEIERDDRLLAGEADDLVRQVAARNRELSAAMITAGNVAVSAAGKIGLTGKTMDRVNIAGEVKAVKDWIKLAATEAGDRAKWQGAQVQWDVTPKAWDILCSKYPEAAKLVSVVAAVD